MPLADGFNRKVTVKSRSSASDYYDTTDDTEVQCRIYPMSPEEVQALGYEIGDGPSHKLLCASDSGIDEGNMLVVTYRKTGSNEWTAVTNGQQFAVVEIDYAEGGRRGANHLRGQLSEMTRTDQ